LLVVIDEDSRIEGTSRQLLAHIYATSISQAVAAYRKDRAYSQLVRNVLLTAVSTILLGLAVFLLVKIFSLTNRFIVKRYHNRIEKIEAQSFRLIHARSILAATRAIIITLTAVIAAGGAYAYLHFVLNLYPWTRRLADGLLHFLLAPLGAVATSILLAIPGLIVVAIIILAARYLLKMTRLFFNAIRDKQISLAGFDVEWADPTMRIVRLLIIVCAAIVAYPYIPGSDSAAFKGVTIFAGLLFSLGSSSLIANLIAGYTMTYRRAFHVGDRIAIGNTIGDVTAIRLMVTHLRSLKNEEIVIPNSAILASEVKNYSSLARNKGLILHTTVGIGYETPWRQVEAMLLMAASRTPGILPDPPPYILQKTLGDFSISYELNAYIDQPLAMYQLYTALHRSILDVFNEYGVQIMTPAYVADPAEPKIVPKERWVAAPAPVTGAPADQSVTTPLPQSNASTVVTLSSRQT
jgi:small-conductance mechanosensitive channel